MDVTARLNFRSDIQELGIAPLTSMFLYAEANRSGFDDYRPQVHDSNGLLVERESGEVMWRALNNSETLGNSYLWENNPRAFGLYQRGRDFETYQDAGAHYERRPSLRVEPIGNWGQGMVRLIEMPAKIEADDNIGAFWVPAEPALAGQSREFAYRLVWGDLNPDDNVLTTVSGGVVRDTVLFRVEANRAWRLVLDVEVNGGEALELKAYLVGLGKTLTETWLYQWRPVA